MNTLTKKEILEPYVLLLRPGSFGLIAANDECSTEGALKAMKQYADQECEAKDKRIKELEDGLREIIELRGKAMSTQQLSPVLQAIEKAKALLPVDEK